MTLGEKIYLLRKQRGLSQEQLAEALNVSRQSISKWEGNLTYPEPEKLIALSNQFQVSLDYLMKADMTDDVEAGDVEQVNDSGSCEPKGEEDREAGHSEGDAGKQSGKSDPILAGVVICIGAVIGLIWLGLMNVLLPESAEQTAASSMITLNGVALLVLLCLGILILGLSLIIRAVRRK